MNDFKMVAAVFTGAFLGTFMGSASAFLFMWFLTAMTR